MSLCLAGEQVVHKPKTQATTSTVLPVCEAGQRQGQSGMLRSQLLRSSQGWPPCKGAQNNCALGTCSKGSVLVDADSEGKWAGASPLRGYLHGFFDCTEFTKREF